MHWILITAIAIFSRAFYSISTKALSSNIKVHANTQAVILPFMAAILSLLLIPFLGFSLDGLAESWWVAILLAASQGLGNIIYFYGQNYIDSGTTQIALSSKLVWSAILSVVFLGSSFNNIQIVGMVLLMVGVLSVQHLGKKNKDIKKGMSLIGISAIVFSVFAVTGADLAGKINPVTYLLVTYLGASLFAFVIGYKDVKRNSDYLRVNSLNVIKYFGYAAVTSTAYFTLVYYAYREAPDPGVVAVLVNAQVVTTVIIASFILKERDHLMRKLAAGATVVIAAYMIAGL